MKCVNKKCLKDFVLQDNVIVRKKEKMFKCPHCGTIHVRTGSSSDLIRDETGKLVRKYKKVRMSKKQRLKQRREKAGA